MYCFQIYIGNRRGKTAVLKNRDILKDLRLGMLVALESKEEIPYIGEVTLIPPNPALESEVKLLLYQQEKASHKPKWLRNFYRTKKEIYLH